MCQFGTQFPDAMILRTDLQLGRFLLAHRLGGLLVQQKVFPGNFVGCLLLNACKLISSFTHKRIPLTFHDLRVKCVGFALQCLLLSSHQLTCHVWINTLLYHCHLGGTIVHMIEVDSVELTYVHTSVQNTWHVPAWIRTAWVKFLIQVTHIAFCCRRT